MGFQVDLITIGTMGGNGPSRCEKKGSSGGSQVCFINPFLNLRDWVRVIVAFY